MEQKLLEIRGLEKKFTIYKGMFGQRISVHAVNGIDFDLFKGETIGIVGESGSGKSTLGRCILRLIEPTKGELIYQNKNIITFNRRAMKKIRKEIQMVFQNPLDSMNGRLSIKEILSEPLIAQNIPQKERGTLISETINLVGLSEKHLLMYPHKLSGGQLQRIVIARAIILKPKILIADEAVSALDVSIQSQIINLFQDLQESLGLSYIFISHDLSVVEHLAHRLGVMYLGELVEFGNKEDIFKEPLHPYTQALLSAVPKTDPDEKKERIILKGELPSPSNPPSGCKFHPRCIYATEVCQTVKPVIRKVKGRKVACHLYE